MITLASSILMTRNKFLDQELISYRYSSCCCCCWGDLFKKPKAPAFRIWTKFVRNVLRVNTHRPTQLDYWC